MTERVQKSIEVEKPISTVYNQWTQFESFPKFMEGVEQVEQRDDQHLHWVAEIGMTEREWDAEIVEQVPDRVVAWKAQGEVTNDGRVTFEEVAPGRTRVNVELEYSPDSFVEKAADKLGLVSKRVEGDLERFKQYIEERGAEEGAWRGEIHQ